MILSSKDMIKEDPETIYQPTVSMTKKRLDQTIKELT